MIDCESSRRYPSLPPEEGEGVCVCVCVGEWAGWGGVSNISKIQVVWRGGNNSGGVKTKTKTKQREGCFDLRSHQ